MKTLKHIGLLIATLITLSANAASRLTIASGNWNSAATWQGGVIPSASDDVIIKGHAITVNTAASILSLTIETGGSLTVNQPMTMTNLTGNINTGIIINAATIAKRVTINTLVTLTMNANMTIAEMVQNAGSTLNVNCNTLTIDNSLSGGSASNVVFMYNAGCTFNNPCCGTVKFTNKGKVTANSNVLHFGKVIMENGIIDIGQNANEYNNIAFDCGIELNNAGSVSMTACKTYDNITLTNTSLNLGTCSTISGFLKLNAGGDIVTNNVIYGTNARLIFNRSYALTSTSKMWATGTGTNVPSVVELQSGTLSTSDTLTIKRRVNLLGGTLGSSSVTKIRLAANDTIFKCGGSFASAPSFGANVTTLYCDPAAGNPPATLGDEMPASGFTGDVIISTNVVLSKDILVPSGKIVVTSSGVLNDSNFKVSAANSVTVQNGGMIKTSKSGGLTGTSSLLGSISTTLSASSTVEFSATSGTQNINQRTDYGNVILSGASAKTFSTGSYQIAGDFTIASTAGTVTVGKATVTFNGTNQNISGTTFDHVTFATSGTKLITSSAVVTGQLNVTGTAVLNTNGNVTLRSTANGTAGIGPLVNGADITGNICWERFIPGGNSRRRWRFLSMPITGQTFKNAWQDEIFITGPGTGGVPCNFNTTSTSSMVQNSNGFDQNQSGVPSIYAWNETTGTWATIPSTFDTINPLKAYRTFVRGDRHIEGCLLLTLMPDSVSSVTIRSCGTPTKFTQSIPLTYTAGTGGGWNYISNPYPSSISWSNSAWSAARSSSINQTIYVYDPNSGQYNSWHPVAGSVNGGSPVIASGQSFFVRTSANTTLTFQETYKVDSTKSGFFGKSEDKATNRVSVVLSSTTGGLLSKDEAVFYMNENASAGFDDTYDGYKFGYSTGSVAVSKKTVANTKFAFEAIPFVTNVDTMTLYTSLGNTDADYSISLSGLAQIDPSMGYLLKDNYDNSITNMRGVSEYTFSVYASSAASYSQNRFQILIVNSASLPVTLTDFKGKKGNNNVSLTWTTSSEVNNSHFVVERSEDGNSFEAIGTVKGNGTTAATNVYSFIDVKPASGTSYYRLRQVDFNGKQELSYVVVISNSDKANPAAKEMSVYPVPAKDVLNIAFNQESNGASVEVIDLLGKVVMSKSFGSTSIDQAGSIDVSTLIPGSYFVNITMNGTARQIRFNKIN